MTLDNQILQWRRRRRLPAALVASVDASAWVVGLCIADWTRYAFEAVEFSRTDLTKTAVVAVLVDIVVSSLLRVKRGRRHIGSVDDVIGVAQTTAVVAVCMFTLNILTNIVEMPRSVPLTAGLLALSISVAARLIVRRRLERLARPDGASARRVIVYGAGLGGQQLVRSMLSDRASGYLPVAVLDDNPTLRRHRLSGVPVRGTRADVVEVAQEAGATNVIVAIRDLDPEVLREVVSTATRAGLGVKVLPALDEVFRSWVGFSDLRDVDITDLLGRRPVDTDISSIAGYLTGKRVLVTGAGGSIGSELCRQLHGFGPSELLMLDRDESALHAVQLSIFGKALLDSSDVILADIRDAEAIKNIFLQRQPEVVFHAAALKHLPMLEQYPDEAWKTNVLGTQHVLDAAQGAGVEKFVNISTDKAANPISVLGRSKRLGERLVAEAAQTASGVYLSVRFGNVLGSRGSVLTTFAEQIAKGGPVTVTHPEVTRFFMTIPEAVQLVIQAAAVGRRGEALVLDMGQPVSIHDVAHQLMDIAGQGVPIVYTGLRVGEKLHEELFGDGETDHRPAHPAISHVEVPGLSLPFMRRHADTVGVGDAMTHLASSPTFLAELDEIALDLATTTSSSIAYQ